MPLFQRFERNTRGRDFVVGDLHGMFHILHFALAQVLNFDYANDRLFSVGDLVDRGPMSEHVLDYLKEPWFYAVRGNHEQMCIDSIDKRYANAEEMHMLNGGVWFFALTDAERREIVDQFGSLPIAIEIDTPNCLVGLVHAEPPHLDWEQTRVMDSSGEPFPIRALWSRDRVTKKDDRHVKNVGMVFCGHTAMERPCTLGNVTYIDTGCVYKNALTIVDITNNHIHTIKHDGALEAGEMTVAAEV